MTALYAIALMVGLAALLVWVAATAVSASVEGWESVDPERRFGVRGRLVVAGFVGFGLAGLSAEFAGWNSGLALGAAVLGAVFSGVASRFLGPAT